MSKEEITSSCPHVTRIVVSKMWLREGNAIQPNREITLKRSKGFPDLVFQISGFNKNIPVTVGGKRI